MFPVNRIRTAIAVAAVAGSLVLPAYSGDRIVAYTIVNGNAVTKELVAEGVCDLGFTDTATEFTLTCKMDGCEAVDSLYMFEHNGFVFNKIIFL